MPSGVKPVTGTLTLRHVSADAWRAAYRFDEAIDDLVLGPAVVEFRRTAWALRTPGAMLVAKDGNESVHAEARAAHELSALLSGD